MKQTILFILTTLLLGIGGKSEMRVCTLTPTPQMHCQSCVDKITGGMKHEKGVARIECSLEKQTVSIWYSDGKNSPAKLQAAMKKIGYETVVVSDLTESEHAAATAKSGCGGAKVSGGEKKGGCGSGGGKCSCGGDKCKCSGCTEHGNANAAPQGEKKSCCSGKKTE